MKILYKILNWLDWWAGIRRFRTKEQVLELFGESYLTYASKTARLWFANRNDFAVIILDTGFDIDIVRTYQKSNIENLEIRKKNPEYTSILFEYDGGIINRECIAVEDAVTEIPATEILEQLTNRTGLGDTSRKPTSV